MIELPAVDGPTHDAVEHIAFIKDVGRVASFHLAPGTGVPETRSTPVLMIASTSLRLEAVTPNQGVDLIQLEAGHAHLFVDGVRGLANAGDADIRFTLIDMPVAE